MNGRKVDLQARADVVTITALRVGVGVILAVHGAMKLMNVSAAAQSFTALGIPNPQYAVYLAIAGELLGGLGLLVGLLTRVSAFGTFSAMVVAIGYAHWGHGLLMKSGGLEYPLVLALASLFFISHGAGPVSLDALAGRRREGRVYRAGRVKSYA